MLVKLMHNIDHEEFDDQCTISMIFKDQDRFRSPVYKYPLDDSFTRLGFRICLLN